VVSVLLGWTHRSRYLSFVISRDDLSISQSGYRKKALPYGRKGKRTSTKKEVNDKNILFKIRKNKTIDLPMNECKFV